MDIHTNDDEAVAHGKADLENIQFYLSDSSHGSTYSIHFLSLCWSQIRILFKDKGQHNLTRVTYLFYLILANLL